MYRITTTVTRKRTPKSLIRRCDGIARSVGCGRRNGEYDVVCDVAEKMPRSGCVCLAAGAVYADENEFGCVCKVVVKTVVGKVSCEQMQDAVIAEDAAY